MRAYATAICRAQGRGSAFMTRCLSTVHSGNRTSSKASSTHDSRTNSVPFMVYPRDKQLVESGTSAHKVESTFITETELRQLASKRSTPLSLAQMYRYASSDVHTGQRLRNAQFLHRELQIRIAQRVAELKTLPCGLGRTRDIQEVIDAYLSYIQLLVEFQSPQTDEEEKEFTQLLQSFILDRKSIPQAIARGVYSLRDHRREKLTHRKMLEMEVALYRFFTARVGLRFLTEHHVLSAPYNVSEMESCEEEDSVAAEGKGLPFRGCIQKDCNPVEEVHKVVRDVTRKCEATFGLAPSIDVVDCTKNSTHGDVFTYVPMHLQYVLSELLKNSCRATIRRRVGNDEIRAKDKLMKGEVRLPPIKVVVVKGAEDVTIKISDVGGGIQRSALDDIWSFAHSTLSNTVESDQFDINAFLGVKLRGFGLPLARVYARYFGGDLTLKSMEGYGVDVYIHLPILGIACENLPEGVILSPGNRDSSVQTRKRDILAALAKRAL